MTTPKTSGDKEVGLCVTPQNAAPQQISCAADATPPILRSIAAMQHPF
jgi:hypothetical protein